MSLDATVFCDCYERGVFLCPPPQPELVFVDETGCLCVDSKRSNADVESFDEWLATVCPHRPSGSLISHRLGNIATIALLREILANNADAFPLLLQKVLYDGTHAGDYLPLDDLPFISIELDRLKTIYAVKENDERILWHFEGQMRELVHAAKSIGKPIAF